MRTVTTVLIAGSLLFGAAACKKSEDRGDMGRTTPKAVEESEQATKGASEDVQDVREDIKDGEGSVREEKIELKEEKGDFKQQRDKFIELGKKKLSELDARIDALKADYEEHGSRLKADTKEELAVMVKKLEEKRAEARASFDRAANATAEGWNDLERSTGQALDDLQTATESADHKFDESGIERAEVKAKLK